MDDTYVMIYRPLRFEFFGRTGEKPELQPGRFKPGKMVPVKISPGVQLFFLLLEPGKLMLRKLLFLFDFFYSPVNSLSISEPCCLTFRG